MNLLQTLPIATRALFRNKTRSFLTTLGVVIGVASVISMVAVGEGAKSSVQKIFEAMGTNLLVLRSGTSRSGGFMGGMGSMPSLTWDDLEAVRTEMKAVRYAAPFLNAKAQVISDYGNWSTTVSGTTPEYVLIRNWRMSEGVFFSDSDVESSAKVAVIGQTTSDSLFGAGVNPVGSAIRIQSIPYQVIGLLEKKGQSMMGQDFDDTVLMPVSAFRSKLQGGLQKYIAGAIFIGTRSADDTYRAEKEITALLRDRHHINPGDDEDFQIRNLTELASAQQQGTDTLSSLLAAIAIVSLLVGGIGIMNIMLVSVTERTREIGVRMAVGAKPWHIMAQFIVEAMTLSMAGGIIGIGAGIGISNILSSKLSWAFVIRPDIIVIAFFFSGLVGIAFGLYPARKAAKLDPIESLRYE